MKISSRASIGEQQEIAIHCSDYSTEMVRESTPPSPQYFSLTTIAPHPTPTQSRSRSPASVCFPYQDVEPYDLVSSAGNVDGNMFGEFELIPMSNLFCSADNPLGSVHIGVALDDL